MCFSICINFSALLGGSCLHVCNPSLSKKLKILFVCFLCFRQLRILQGPANLIDGGMKKALFHAKIGEFSFLPTLPHCRQYFGKIAGNQNGNSKHDKRQRQLPRSHKLAQIAGNIAVDANCRLQPCCLPVMSAFPDGNWY